MRNVVVHVDDEGCDGDNERYDAESETRPSRPTRRAQINDTQKDERRYHPDHEKYDQHRRRALLRMSQQTNRSYAAEHDRDQRDRAQTGKGVCFSLRAQSRAPLGSW